MSVILFIIFIYLKFNLTFLNIKYFFVLFIGYANLNCSVQPTVRTQPAGYCTLSLLKLKKFTKTNIFLPNNKTYFTPFLWNGNSESANLFPTLDLKSTSASDESFWFVITCLNVLVTTSGSFSNKTSFTFDLKELTVKIL